MESEIGGVPRRAARFARRATVCSRSARAVWGIRYSAFIVVSPVKKRIAPWPSSARKKRRPSLVAAIG
jgi:hypothetical protein